MSQIYKSLAASPGVPNSFVTDSGTATPAANVLNILGNDTSANDNDGLTTSGSGNTVTVLLTNRQTGQVTTTDATPADLISFTFSATPTVATFDGFITAKAASNGHGASWRVFASFRSDGASTTEIGFDSSLNFKDSDLVTPTAVSNINITFSAVGNAAVLRAVGIAATTINWDGLINYRQVQ